MTIHPQNLSEIDDCHHWELRFLRHPITTNSDWEIDHGTFCSWDTMMSHLGRDSQNATITVVGGVITCFYDHSLVVQQIRKYDP